MPIDRIFEKLSFAEILSIVFIVSVGLSLLYKYGFYTELGISWFINTLSPQELLISCINYVFFSLVGILLGALSVYFSQKYLEAVLSLMFAIFLIFAFSDNFLLNTLKGEISLMLIFATSMLYLMKINDRSDGNFEEKKISDIKRRNLKLLEKIFSPIFAFVIILFPLYKVYEQGKSDARGISSVNNKVSYAELKEDKTRWILVEMRGDKIIIKKSDNEQVFKIVEYKDIDIYTFK